MPKKKLTTQKSELPFPSLSREELENLLSDLYVKFDNVRNFIDLRMTGDSRTLVNKYKKLIKNRLIEDIEEGTNGLDEALQCRIILLPLHQRKTPYSGVYDNP